MKHAAPSKSIVRLGTGELFSEAVAYDGLLFLSGQVAHDGPSSPFEAQLEEVLLHINALLEAGHSDRSRLLSALIHLSSAEHVGEFNRIWAEWLPKGAAPARTTVISPLVSPGYLVEITIIAAVPNLS